MSKLAGHLHGAPNGFPSLKPAAKTYLALRCLVDTVGIDGFYQYFVSSSGNLYAYAVEGLLELEEPEALHLLTSAKVLLLSEQPVPMDQRIRAAMLPRVDLLSSELLSVSLELEDLAKRFRSGGARLDERCSQFAWRHDLHSYL